MRELADWRDAAFGPGLDGELGLAPFVAQARLDPGNTQITDFPPLNRGGGLDEDPIFDPLGKWLV